MSLMLPKNVSRRLPDDNTLESRMNCLKVTSSYRWAALSQTLLEGFYDGVWTLRPSAWALIASA